MRKLFGLVALASMVACASTAGTTGTSSSPPASSGPAPYTQPVTASAAPNPTTTIAIGTTTSGASTEVTSTVPPVPATIATPSAPAMLPPSLQVDAITLPGGRSLPVQILPDGRSIQSPPSPNHDTNPAGQLDLYSAGSNRQQQRIVDDVKPGLPIPKCFDADTTWLVWSGDSDQAMWMADWTVSSFNTATGERHQIGAAPAGPAGTAASGPFVYPRVDNGIAVWSSISVREPYGKLLDTYMAPADGSAPMTVLEPDAVDPDIAWPYVFVRKIQDPANSTTLVIVRIDLRTGERRTLDKAATRGQLSVTKDRLLTETGDGHLVITDFDGNVRWDIAPIAALIPSYPVAGDRFFLWYDRVYAWIFFPDTGGLYQLGSRPDANQVMAAGPWALWVESPDPAATPNSDNIAFHLIKVTATA